MMPERSKALELYSIFEMSYLRLEAMDVFEYCLTEGSPDRMKTFIDHQIMISPPRVELLREVADDLFLRLLALREHHHDIREWVWLTLRDDFDVDISPLAPSNPLDGYHLLEIDTILAFLNQHNPRLDQHDAAMLHQTIEASLQMAARLYADVIMTQELHAYLRDWLDGLYTAHVRYMWANPWETYFHDRIH
ncbi:MAG: hypothetical protein K8I60_01505 [Anaerolineae bacterium]|nr:hypothetical protein [Anaerolineae bacterium]